MSFLFCLLPIFAILAIGCVNNIDSCSVSGRQSLTVTPGLQLNSLPTQSIQPSISVVHYPANITSSFTNPGALLIKS